MAEAVGALGVSVIGLSGREVASLQVQGEHSADSVKRDLERQCGYPVSAQQLVCGGLLLEDSFKLASLPSPALLTLVLLPFEAEEAVSQAVFCGHEAAVKQLLSAQSVVERSRILTGQTKDLLFLQGVGVIRKSSTLLHVAAMRGKESEVRTLLSYAACAHELRRLLAARDGVGCTPFDVALQHRHPAVAVVLLEVSDSEERSERLASTDGDGRTVLHHIAMDVDGGSLQGLLDLAISAAERRALVAAQDHRGLTPLSLAVLVGNAAAVRDILVSVGSEERYVLLLVQDYCGNSPLHTASKHGDAEIVKMLLASDIPAEQRDAILATRNEVNRTPFEVAVVAYKPAAALAFIQCTASRQERDAMMSWADECGGTLLFRVVKMGDAVTLAALLALASPEERKAMLTAQDSRGQTALHVAVHAREEHMVRSLLELSTPKERRLMLALRDDGGCDPFELAASHYERPMFGALAGVQAFEA